MITLPLRIRYSHQPLRAASAWLIPGADCGVWLAETLRWETPLVDLVIYVVPRSSADITAQGVLVIVPEGCSPRVSSRCQPYARTGQPAAGAATVYVPTQARFEPDAADTEIAELIGSKENVYLWHPACGLVGFEPGDRRCAANLLVAPPERKTSWGMARPGVNFSRRLTGIEPDWTPSLESALQAGQDDIGSESSALKKLPPGPEEPPAGLLARMVSTVKQHLTELLQKREKEPEESGGKAESAQGVVGQTAGESACVADGSRAELPGKETSAKPMPGDKPEGVAPQSIGAENGGRGLGRFTAGAIGAAVGMAPALGQGLAGLKQRFVRLGRWFRDKKRRFGRATGRPPRRPSRKDEKLLTKRHREMLRLMHTLATDPDTGLRYAIPLNSMHRDAGRPGSKLVHHDVDFSLVRLRGGEPADFWQVPWDLREQLLAKYHELAGREMRLGRFRRAAYIYAELIGNVELAASALMAGRHWREAAVLYRDRLHRPDEAARCLEQGGLWTEAIALYEAIREHEKVGDLYRQLDQFEHAQQAYQAAVAKYVARNDYLAAARLLETKLDAPDDALAQLGAGWPSSDQAGTCLRELFRLLARLGRHEAAAAKVGELQGLSLVPRQMLLLIDILSETATTYPDAAVAAAAADATRTFVSARLREATGEEKPHLLEAMRRLVPADRLLGRDCQRFLRPRGQPKPPIDDRTTRECKTVSPAPASVLTQRIREIKLSERVRWQTAVSAGNVVYAAGYEGGDLVVEQAFWDGTHVRLDGGLWDGLPLGGRPILLAPDPRGQQSLVVCVVGGPSIPEQRLPVADASLGRVRAGTPSWIGPDTVAVQRTNSGMTHVLQRHADGLVLHFFNSMEQPLGSRHLSISEILSDGADATLPLDRFLLHARSDATCLALGRRLLILKANGGVARVELPDTILSLDGSPPSSSTRLVATMETGAVLYWDDLAQRRSSLATDLIRPMARFTEGGWLVIASADLCQVYRAEGRRIRLEADSPGRNVELLAVLDTGDPNQFALFGVDGIIRVYEMPHR